MILYCTFYTGLGSFQCMEGRGTFFSGAEKDRLSLPISPEVPPRPSLLPFNFWDGVAWEEIKPKSASFLPIHGGREGSKKVMSQWQGNELRSHYLSGLQDQSIAEHISSHLQLASLRSCMPMLPEQQHTPEDALHFYSHHICFHSRTKIIWKICEPKSPWLKSLSQFCLSLTDIWGWGVGGGICSTLSVPSSNNYLYSLMIQHKKLKSN